MVSGQRTRPRARPVASSRHICTFAAGLVACGLAAIRVPEAPPIAPAETLYTVPISSAFAWGCTFILDHVRHRVLVAIVGDVHDSTAVHLHWLTKRRLVAAGLGGPSGPVRAGLYAVDFRQRWLYVDAGPGALSSAVSRRAPNWRRKVHVGGDPLGGLARLSFDGDNSQQLTASPRTAFVIPRAHGDILDAVEFWPAGSGAPPGPWFVVYVNGKQVSGVRMKQLPGAILYAARADRLFIVCNDRVEASGGAAGLALPRSAQAAADYPFYYPIDITPDAAYIYYADPETRIISKIRVSTGLVVAQRRLDYTPLSVAVEISKGRLILAGEKVGCATTAVDAIHVIRRF